MFVFLFLVYFSICSFGESTYLFNLLFFKSSRPNLSLLYYLSSAFFYSSNWSAASKSARLSSSIYSLLLSFLFREYPILSSICSAPPFSPFLSDFFSSFYFFIFSLSAANLAFNLASSSIFNFSLRVLSF